MGEHLQNADYPEAAYSDILKSVVTLSSATIATACSQAMVKILPYYNKRNTYLPKIEATHAEDN